MESYHDYVSVRKVHKCVNSEAVLEGLGKDIRDSRKEYSKLIRKISGREKDFLVDVKYGMVPEGGQVCRLGAERVYRSKRGKGCSVITKNENK